MSPLRGGRRPKDCSPPNSYPGDCGCLPGVCLGGGGPDDTVSEKQDLRATLSPQWMAFAFLIRLHPRDPSRPLQIHCIPDGSTLRDDSDPDNYRQWPEDDGINVLEPPRGSPAFIEAYLFGKAVKHRVPLNFIQEIAASGFPREVVAMLTGAASQRLVYLLK